MTTFDRAAILFRFHEEFALCRERLKFVRSLNRTVPVFGLYGGPRGHWHDARLQLASLLDDIWATSRDDGRWAWCHGDIVIRDWFSAHGHRLAFDRLYEHEYDLLLARPYAELIPAIGARAVGLSGLTELAPAVDRWYWTAVEPHASGFRRYSDFLRDRFGLEQQTFVTQGPFPVLTREFLEAMCGTPIPNPVLESVICEISYAGIAEVLGFEIVDTGLHPGWTPSIPSISASPLFHCEKTPLVEIHHITAELQKPDGLRAFHPVKQFLAYEMLRSLI